MIPGLERSAGEGNSWASCVAQLVKNLPAMQETWAQSLGWEDPLEEGIAIHSSILAWRIPWTEEPVRLQSMGLQRVGHGCLGHGVWAVNSTRETLKALVLSVTLRGPGVEG